MAALSAPCCSSGVARHGSSRGGRKEGRQKLKWVLYTPPREARESPTKGKKAPTKANHPTIPTNAGQSPSRSSHCVPTKMQTLQRGEREEQDNKQRGNCVGIGQGGGRRGGCWGWSDIARFALVREQREGEVPGLRRSFSAVNGTSSST